MRDGRCAIMHIDIHCCGSHKVGNAARVCTTAPNRKCGSHGPPACRLGPRVIGRHRGNNRSQPSSNRGPRHAPGRHTLAPQSHTRSTAASGRARNGCSSAPLGAPARDPSGKLVTRSPAQQAGEGSGCGVGKPSLSVAGLRLAAPAHEGATPPKWKGESSNCVLRAQYLYERSPTRSSSSISVLSRAHPGARLGGKPLVPTPAAPLDIAAGSCAPVATPTLRAPARAVSASVGEASATKPAGLPSRAIRAAAAAPSPGCQRSRTHEPPPPKSGTKTRSSSPCLARSRSSSSGGSGRAVATRKRGSRRYASKSTSPL
mmetsp:Transcript_28113/g.85886  ORF Transcript_28113/g.85886 Transcript_28113/m.85886 type:complete len:316 (-) Transcript_28113:1327-2274(-)|eukprot:scaffold13424_cov23-Tisochrysis_lutea.AAC.1